MTANAFEEDRKQALDAGMDGFLTKPIVVSELVKAVGKAVKPIDNYQGMNGTTPKTFPFGEGGPP